MKNSYKLIISLVIPQFIGMSAALITNTGEGSWYRQIQKPEWNPPGSVFGPVWTTLYFMMGLALYLVWKKKPDTPQKTRAITFWAIQMGLNFLWSLIFFGMENIAGAMIEIAFLWLFILLTILGFAKISRPATWLMIPYICWVSFAAALNYTIWMMNR